MRLTASQLRGLIREAILGESFSAGDLVVLTGEPTIATKYQPGTPDHGRSFSLRRVKPHDGSLVVSQALGPAEHSQWGIKVPVKGYGGVYFVDPGNLEKAPEGVRPPTHRVDSTWWARHREEMDANARLKDLGLRRGAGRYDTSHWEVWEAPEDLRSEDAVMSAFKEKAEGWPVWSAKAISDPETGQWYVNYEIDTSG